MDDHERLEEIKTLFAMAKQNLDEARVVLRRSMMLAVATVTMLILMAIMLLTR